MICRTSRSTNFNIHSVHNVILQDITISFCCFQLLCSNTLCGFHSIVVIIWFYNLVFTILVCPTLFPLFGFHTEQLAAFRLFLKNKSGTRCLATLALPLSVTGVTANVRFRKIRKHFVFQKKASAASLSEEQIGSITSIPVILLLILLLLFLRLLVLPILLLLLRVLLLLRLIFLL